MVCYGKNGCAEALAVWFRVYSEKQVSGWIGEALRCYAYVVNSMVGGGGNGGNQMGEVVGLSVEVIRAVMGMKRGNND